MKITFSKVLLSSLVGASFAIVSSAHLSADAFSISFGSASRSSNTLATGASAKADFGFTQIDPNKVQINLTLLNTTGKIPAFGKGATQSTLVGFGFDLLDSLKSFTYSALLSPFTQLYGDKTLNSSVLEAAKLEPFGTFDVGIRSAGSGNFTGGNPQEGLKAGESKNVQFTLTGSNLKAADIETAFASGFKTGDLKVAVRFQQVDGPSFRGASDKLLGGTVQIVKAPPKPKPIPESAPIAGLCLVAGTLAIVRRRQVKPV